MRNEACHCEARRAEAISIGIASSSAKDRWRTPRNDDRGIALVVAMAAALAVSIAAAVVLTFTFQQFHLTVFESDHAEAFTASDAGLQYVFARLKADTTSNGICSDGIGDNGFKDLV